MIDTLCKLAPAELGWLKKLADSQLVLRCHIAGCSGNCAVNYMHLLKLY